MVLGVWQVSTTESNWRWGFDKLNDKLERHPSKRPAGSAASLYIP